MPASFNLFFCPVSVSVVDVLVLYCVCRGGGSIPPVSFCAGALPRLFRLVLDFQSGGIALTLLGAGHSPQTQKKSTDKWEFGGWSPDKLELGVVTTTPNKESEQFVPTPMDPRETSSSS